MGAERERDAGGKHKQRDGDGEASGRISPKMEEGEGGRRERKAEEESKSVLLQSAASVPLTAGWRLI